MRAASLKPKKTHSKKIKGHFSLLPDVYILLTEKFKMLFLFFLLLVSSLHLVLISSALRKVRVPCSQPRFQPYQIRNLRLWLSPAPPGQILEIMEIGVTRETGSTNTEAMTFDVEAGKQILQIPLLNFHNGKFTVIYCGLRTIKFTPILLWKKYTWLW